jgi:glycosidase
MIWFILEHWFTFGIAGAYIAAVGFAYIRFGREVAIAVALLGAGAFLYRKGRSDATQAHDQRADDIEQRRRDAYDEIDNRGTTGADVRDRLRSGDY